MTDNALFEMDKVAGRLEVGVNDKGEVVVNHPDLKPDADGVGHIVFSPTQARNFADMLKRKALEVDGGTAQERTDMHEKWLKHKALKAAAEFAKMAPPWGNVDRFDRLEAMRDALAAVGLFGPVGKNVVEEHPVMKAYNRALIDLDAGRIFYVEKSEWPAAEAFIAKHDELHKDKYHGAIGGCITFSFTDTSIGTIVTVKCYCGESFDLSGLL